MIDYELTLFDRLEVIKTTNDKYNLLENAYISFSGGKDSAVLSALVDLALPNNNIPRVFINTGIEYHSIVEYVHEMMKKDKRFIEITPTQNIKSTLEKFGYPMKSKEHSHILATYQNSGLGLSVKKYLKMIEGNRSIVCPKKLKYQFTEDFTLKCSDKCCYKLKKEPSSKWAKENNKSIVLTGMQKAEGGQRLKIGCVVFKGDELVKFHPLAPISNDFEEWFIKEYDIKLCELYYPPYNFTRTGCKGCPFNLDLENQLYIMKKLLPNEYKQCEYIWKPVYDEYRRIKYRLKE